MVTPVEKSSLLTQRTPCILMMTSKSISLHMQIDFCINTVFICPGVPILSVHMCINMFPSCFSVSNSP